MGMHERIFRGLLYPLYETVLLRRKTLRYFKEYEQSQWSSPEELQKRQWLKLQALLEHCYQHVPYYQNQWKRLAIEPRNIREMGDFERLPVLTKDDIRANYQDLIATNYRGKTMSKSTGGSTGVPLTFEYTRESYERRTAVMWRGYGWAQSRLGGRTAFLWGGDVGEVSWSRQLKVDLYHRLFNRKMLNSFAMTKSNLDTYVSSLNRHQPKVIVSYVGPLYRLARHIEATSLAIWSPTSIITGAEPLMPYQRTLIEKVFGCPVFNTYGSREFLLIAAECSAKEGLHMSSDHLVVESLNEKGKSVIGDSGDIAITDLHNYGMPFIRYLNGDLGTIGTKPCSCGRGLPSITSLEGRKLDAIQTRDGHILPGEYFPHLMKELSGLNGFQVVQESLDRITISMVRGATFDVKSLDFITSEIRKVLGDSAEVDYRFVDEIPLTRTGKHRVTISKVTSDPQA